MMNLHESSGAAVSRVLRHHQIEPSNVLVMMLIDAVRDTTPPPREVTIGMLTKILQSLDPSPTVEAWAVRSSREIVAILSRRPEVRRIADFMTIRLAPMSKHPPKMLWTHPSLGPITFRRYLSILGGLPYRQCSAWLRRRAKRMFRHKIFAARAGRVY